MKRMSPSKSRHFKKQLLRRWNRGLPEGFKVGLIGSPLRRIRIHRKFEILLTTSSTEYLELPADERRSWPIKIDVKFNE